MRGLITTFAVLIGFLATGATPAFAAKGVKKKDGSEAVHKGVIVSITPIQGQATGVKKKGANNANNVIAEITIKAHHAKKKSQPAAKGGKTGQHLHKFTIHKDTKFTLQTGKQQAPASLAVARVGEHVHITSKNMRAEHVTLISKAKKA
jgi:hypothetical protein